MAKHYQRAPWHNYKTRSIYHITITKAPEAPSFGHVKGDINAEYSGENYPRCIESTIGKVIFFNIKAIPVIIKSKKRADSHRPFSIQLKQQ